MARPTKKPVEEVIRKIQKSGDIWVQTGWGSGSIQVTKKAALAELKKMRPDAEIVVIAPTGVDMTIICGEARLNHEALSKSPTGSRNPRRRRSVRLAKRK